MPNFCRLLSICADTLLIDYCRLYDIIKNCISNAKLATKVLQHKLIYLEPLKLSPFIANRYIKNLSISHHRTVRKTPSIFKYIFYYWKQSKI